MGVFWLKVCALVITMVMGTCGHEGHDHQEDRNTSTVTVRPQEHSLTQAYLYGTLSVSVVSILSLAGVAVLPFIKRKRVYDGTMLVFMALSVGTMASDALLHLIPETIGLHSHSHGEAGHNHSSQEEEEKEGDKPYLGKMVALLATLYALYLLELFAFTASKVVKTISVQDSSAQPPNTAEKNSPEQAAVNMEMREIGGHGHSHGPPAHIGGANSICGLKPVAFVVVVSDGLHNFADGLAIGAGFAKSLSSGLAVSIAVVCHELPHEVGDFAILLSTGMSVKKALLLNFVSALTCFAGLYPGIVAGQQEALRQWIFAAVAGGFLYVALAHMLREIREYGRLPWYLSLALQNVGLILGFIIIFLLAIYEDRLETVGG